MKKLIALLMAAIMVLSFVACGPQDDSSEMLPEETPEATPDTPAEDPTMDQPATMPEDPTMDQPAAMPEVPEMPEVTPEVTPEVPSEPTVDDALMLLVDGIYAIKTPEFMTMTIPVDLADPDALLYYTGLTDASLITSAVVSESAIGSQAYSLVLVRVADPSKLAEVADAMENGIDTRKWMCVEADDLRVVGVADMVMLIMIDSEYAASITADDMVEALKQATGLDLDVE